MKFSIANLSDGINDCALTAEPNDLGLAENFAAKVKVRLTVDKSNRELYLRARVATEARFHCDRCLEEFTQKLENSYRMFYVYSEDESPKHERDEVTVIAPETSSIDISEDVRQYLLLAVPPKLLCREGCRGLCGYCGVNLNHGRCTCPKEGADPRWETLRRLQKN
ncbi:MAG: DUF177 domain-containing protein [Bacteroidota bacterium]